MITDKKYSLLRHLTGLCLISIFIMALILTLPSEAAISYAATKNPKLNIRILNTIKNTKHNLRVYNTLESQSVQFESDDTDIVAIRKVRSTSCRLVAKATGNTVINAYIYDENEELVTTLTCTVTVSPRAASVKFNKKKYKLTVGTTKRIKAIVKPITSCENPLYSSEDTSIATVSSNGTVTALAPGQTTIKAYISNGRESSYTLNVIESPAPVHDVDGTGNSVEPTATPQPSSSESADQAKGKPDVINAGVK